MGFALGVTFVATELLDRHMLVVATPLNFRPKKTHVIQHSQVYILFFWGGGGKGSQASVMTIFVNFGWVLTPRLEGSTCFRQQKHNVLATYLKHVCVTYQMASLLQNRSTSWGSSCFYVIYMSKHYICIYNSTSNKRAELLHSMQLQLYSSLPTFLYNITKKTCVGIHTSYETHRFHTVFLAEHIMVSNQDQVYLPMIT